MYEVKLINNNEETIINIVSTDIEAPRLLNGSIKKGINTIDTFTFTISPKNIGYNKISPLTTLVEVKNVKTNKMEFKGRVLLPTETMDANGELIKNITCESELGYLMDSVQNYGEYHNISVRDFLQTIIDNHNGQVSKYKQFHVGDVTVKDNNDSLYRFLGYDKTLDTIKDKLINRLGGELQISYENNIRYLDYLESMGEVKETEIRLSKNLKTIEQEKDPTAIISRLIPLGEKIEDSEKRLTVESVNNGVKYIDDPLAINEFGIIVDAVTWDNVTKPDNLLRKGKEFLKENNKIKKKYKVSALDLSVINLDLNSFNIGNYYPVINPLMGIDEPLRVIEKTIDINSPQNSNLTVGDKFDTLTQQQAKMQVTSDKISSMLTDNGINTVYLQGQINLLRNRMRAMADTAEKQEAKAILFEDRVPGSKTYGAMALGTQGFMIADTFTNGEWQWRTFGTGKGFVADCIVAGRIIGNNAEFNLNEGFLKIAHKDGTYSKMDINGFQHYIAGRPYPYLGLVTASSEILVNTQQQGSGGATGNYGITKVQLPSEFRGKSLKIMVNYQRINDVSMGIGDVLIPGVSWQNYNSTNATFDIIGYLYHTDKDGNIKYGGGIVASYMAVV